jgi:hypothetical protein
VPSTLTGVAASATQSTSPTASAPADGDSLAAGGVQGPFQTILNHIAKIWAGAFAALGSNPALQATGSATRAGLNLVPQAAPSGPSDGDVWVETTSNQVKARVAGATQTLGVTANSPTAITPNANWTAGAGLAYWKDAVGMVHLKGTVTAGAGASGVAFTLPVGFRPLASRGFAIPAPGKSPDVQVGTVSANGDFAPGAVATGNVFEVDVVHFLAEQ